MATARASASLPCSKSPGSHEIGGHGLVDEQDQVAVQPLDVGVGRQRAERLAEEAGLVERAGEHRRQLGRRLRRRAPRTCARRASRSPDRGTDRSTAPRRSRRSRDRPCARCRQRQACSSRSEASSHLARHDDAPPELEVEAIDPVERALERLAVFAAGAGCRSDRSDREWGRSGPRAPRAASRCVRS